MLAKSGVKRVSGGAKRQCDRALCSGVKRVSGGAKRQCDRALCAPRGRTGSRSPAAIAAPRAAMGGKVIRKVIFTPYPRPHVVLHGETRMKNAGARGNDRAAHGSTSRCSHPAASLHAVEAQGQPLARSHRNASRWPPPSRGQFCH